MSNPEQTQPPQESLVRILHASMERIEGHVLEKYQTVKPQTEARLDARVYAASQREWFEIEPYGQKTQPSKDETEHADSMREMWDRALEGVRHNDWEHMRNALQTYARSSAGSAADQEFFQNVSPHAAFDSGESDERRSDAFINLIRSLG